jgi:hypothetical protein
MSRAGLNLSGGRAWPAGRSLRITDLSCLNQTCRLGQVLYLLFRHSVHSVRCGPHPDQVLRKMAAPHKRLNRPELRGLILCYDMNNNQHDALFTFSLLSCHTCTCFGRISSPSSGGIMYICDKWYLLFFWVDCQRAWHAHRVTRHNTPIHNILSTDPQLKISQKALGTLPEDGNVMPKHVGDTIHN